MVVMVEFLLAVPVLELALKFAPNMFDPAALLAVAPVQAVLISGKKMEKSVMSHLSRRA